MAEVLRVHRDLALYHAEAVRDTQPLPVYVDSVDEKPGVQAPGTTAPELSPVPGTPRYQGR